MLFKAQTFIRLSALTMVIAATVLLSSTAIAKGPSERPLKGTFSDFTLDQAQDHFFEELGCGGGPFAGPETTAQGKVSHLGKTESTLSTAWDWGTPAAGVYTSVGPTTASSATVVGVHSFEGQVFPAFGCIPWDTTGMVTLTAASGDQVTGDVTGGEIYELGFVVAGDGQESFIAVTIMGGTGRFAGATGSFVTHSIIGPTGIVSSELSGTIGY